MGLFSKRLVQASLATAFATLSLGMIAGCSAPNDNIEMTDADVLAVDPHPERMADPVRASIGRQFIVEHFEASVNSSILTAISQHRPGGFVFWNSNSASGSDLREVIRTYAAKAATTGTRQPLLFSTDYEGGGLSLTPNLNRTNGIQRFRKGMTGLVHPVWLEASMEKYGTELCRLHGQIMAQELASVGINYPLTMVSDLSNALFTLRSVSKDSTKVSACVRAALDGFIQNGHVVFVTKHFPGLGQTRGDTHDMTVVSKVLDQPTAMDNLKPFTELVGESKKQNGEALLSILASHGEFPFFDPGHITTESPKILKRLLRSQMGFRGIVVSDAMWMGAYGSMSLTQILPIYLNSFASGMDLLMIKGVHFGAAVDFFRRAYDNELTAQEIASCEQRSGLSWTELRRQFIARMNESNGRLSAVNARVGDARASMEAKGEAPRLATKAIRDRYDQILMSINAGWRDQLPSMREQEAAQ